MKRTALALQLISVLFFSTMAGIQLVSLGKANPYWWYEQVPPDEYTEAPIISVLSPANNTAFNVDSICLSFSVDVGESKTALDTLLLLVICEADWQHDYIAQFAPWSGPYPFVHEMNLTGIPEGNHSITVQAIERGTYPGGALAFNIESSETIFFTITTNLETEIPEFPSWIILPLLIVATLVGVIIRNKIRKKGLE